MRVKERRREENKMLMIIKNTTTIDAKRNKIINKDVTKNKMK